MTRHIRRAVRVRVYGVSAATRTPRRGTCVACRKASSAVVTAGTGRTFRV